MLVFFIYAAIIVLCVLSYQLYLNLKEKVLFNQVISYLIITLLVHVIFSALFRDIIPGYSYVDIGAPFGLLYGPFLYIGYLAYKFKSIKKSTIILHGLPFGFALIAFIVFLSSDFIRLNYGQLYYIVLYSLFGLSWITYPIFVLLKGNINDFMQMNIKRLYFYFIILLLVLAAFIIPSVMTNLFGNVDNGYSFSGIIVFIVMLIGITMIYNYLLRLLVFENQTEERVTPNLLIKKHNNPSISSIVHQNKNKSPYRDKIIQYLEEKKYLNPEFNIDSMARDLKIPRNLITQFFKDYFNQNVLKTINSLRIEEVCKELVKPDFDLNIDDLAFTCGFSSRASFYRNFNLEKHCTPIEYRELYLLKDELL